MRRFWCCWITRQGQCTIIVENSAISIFNIEPETKLRKKCMLSGHRSLCTILSPSAASCVLCIQPLLCSGAKWCMPEKFTCIKVTSMNKLIHVTETYYITEETVLGKSFFQISCLKYEIVLFLCVSNNKNYYCARILT